MRRTIGDLLLIVLGIFSAAFGLESFLLPNSFIDGGATGISLLISENSTAPLYILLPLINLPFLFLAYSVVSKEFAIKSALSISGLAVVLFTVNFPEVTHDKLLVAVFGGCFIGAGIGFSVRGGAVLDGTEILALYLNHRLPISIGDIILVINVFIFLAAAYLLSVEAALYSMLTYVAASKTLDYIIEGIEEYTGVTIVSSYSEEIRLKIIEQLGHGVSVYKGKRGYGKHGDTDEIDIIYTVITRLEVSALTKVIDEVDSDAFVVMSSIKDTRGGMIKKRSMPH